MSTKKKSLKDQLKPLFFPIHKIEVPDKGFKFAPALTHWIVATTPSGPLVVNSCSKNYGLISNEELMMPIVERFENSHEVEAKVTQWGYSKFYTDFIIKDVNVPLKKDMLFPRIRMNNSYDGSVKYQFSFGFYRLVCENGLSVPLKGFQSKDIKLRHTPGNTNSAIDTTMKTIEVFLENAPKVAASYTELMDRKLQWDQALQLIADVIEETKFPKKSEEKVIERLTLEHKEMKLPINDFLVYNALNHTLYNLDTQMKTHKRDKVDQQVLNFLYTR